MSRWKGWWAVMLPLAMVLGSMDAEGREAGGVKAALLPQPREVREGRGSLRLRGKTVQVRVPAGPADEACRSVLSQALSALGARVALADAEAGRFTIGESPALPPLPDEGIADEGYVLVVTPRGAAAQARSATGLLYAAQTLRQLARLGAAEGRIPCVTLRDSPEFRLRGIYIEGGQERFGRIVAKEYLLAQIRRLSELKMNALVIECYNLFPFASFPACADAGTLPAEACREIVAEAKRWHVTLIPSLMTLAQASELVWGNDAGAPYREATAPGLVCPSNPAVYPFIKGLYRDLLTWFDEAPLLGIGCSEIDMQWQGRYCPRCKARVDAGEGVRDLLLGHAEKCIGAVRELSKELGRPVRPMMWGDEFYMYGPGRDWVGIDRIPRDTVMGFWKYWQDYAGIAGLMERGYDVFGVSAMYNHTFYLADLSPEDPPKVWSAMAQTGTANIAEMMKDADRARRTHPGREFLGTATASFSKHRLRAFDSIWYGFALNAQCNWSHPERPLPAYQDAFTRAFARHFYDARTPRAAGALGEALIALDRCKSQLELANQTLHDVVGVVDTQEPGYTGNTLLGAWRRCAALTNAEGTPKPELLRIREAAVAVAQKAPPFLAQLDGVASEVGCAAELADLRLAGEKIASHARREVLLIDAAAALAAAPHLPEEEARRRLGELARLWGDHCREVEGILARVKPLYSQGDPCGFAGLLCDARAIEGHLACLAASSPAAGGPATGDVLLDERWEKPDPSRWSFLGEPRLSGGTLETRAPGGWEKYSGVVTREAFPLEDARPLVVEVDLTPLQLGIDSQLLASSDGSPGTSYRFSFYGPRDRFGIYTRSAGELPGPWVDTAPGWRLRALSPEVKPGATYRVRAEIAASSFRVVVREPGESPWQIPFWDSGRVPMDPLERTHLLFGDVEPAGATASSRWGPLRILRP